MSQDMMAQRFCLHLGGECADGTRGPAQDYPSFENVCFAVELIDARFDEMNSRDQLLLADQATYCLGSGHRLCPRFRLLAGRAGSHAGVNGDASAGRDSESSDETLFVDFTNPSLFDDALDDADDEPPRPRIGLWIGAASFLLVLVLCGGSLAIYTGWQLVGRGLLPMGNRLAQMSSVPEQNQIFLLVTPTPSTPLGPPTVPVLAAQVQPASLLPTPQPTVDFPKAVTATPESALVAQIRNNANNDTGEVIVSSPGGPIVITTPTSPSPAGVVEEGDAPVGSAVGDSGGGAGARDNAGRCTHAAADAYVCRTQQHTGATQRRDRNGDADACLSRRCDRVWRSQSVGLARWLHHPVLACRKCARCLPG